MRRALRTLQILPCHLLHTKVLLRRLPLPAQAQHRLPLHLLQLDAQASLRLLPQLMLMQTLMKAALCQTWT